jgi:hypothetical protein
MEGLIILRYPPSDIASIEEIVAKNKSFVLLVEGNYFSILEHLNFNNPLKARAMADLNFTEKIASLAQGEFRGKRNLEPYRWAAAVLAFCQISEIDFAYDSSMFEFASIYGQDEALEKRNAFDLVNNIDPKHLIDFALERTNFIPSHAFDGLDDVLAQKCTTRFDQTGFYFQVNYICVLKIALLATEPIKDFEKVIKFIDWMLNEFMFCAPALQFANIYFSPSKLRKMLKGHSKKAILNATWDLTLVQEWGKRAIVNRDLEKPLMLISRDKAVKEIASRLCADTEDEFRTHLTGPWDIHSEHKGKQIYEHYEKCYRSVCEDVTRRCKSEEELARLKNELEVRLFGLDYKSDL